MIPGMPQRIERHDPVMLLGGSRLWSRMISAGCGGLCIFMGAFLFSRSVVVDKVDVRRVLTVVYGGEEII